MSNKLDKINLPLRALSANKSLPLGEIATGSLPFSSFMAQATRNPSALESAQQGLNIDPLSNLNQKQPQQDIMSQLIAQGVSNDQIDVINQLAQRIEENTQYQPPYDPKTVNQQVYNKNRLEVTPFQLFLDKTVEALESISETEFRVNDLTEKYIRGEVSIDEVSMEATKLNLAVSFATTVITTATQTFTQLTQMAI